MPYLKESIAELVGTFTLVFIGGYAVVVADTVIIPALAHGLILVGIIYTYGHISGAHVNPAVTLAQLITRYITVDRAVVYMVAQFIGAIVAALLIVVIAPDTGAGFNYGQTKGTLTDDHLWQAVLLEAVLTFFLVSAVFQAGVHEKAGFLAAVAIGFTLAGSILAGGVLSGASLNPARTLGPALTAGEFDYVIPYFIGIFGGGAVGGLLQGTILAPTRDTTQSD
jgi:MIP family channel proteins